MILTLRGHMKELIWAIVLGVVEGVTEFLPISSTGHLLLCQQWMGIDLEHDPFWRMFAIFIQFGAIASVIVYFREKIRDSLKAGGRWRSEQGGVSLPWLVTLATLPVLAIGALIEKRVDAMIGDERFRNLVIMLALGIGGLLMILLEYVRPRTRYEEIDDIPLAAGVIVGLSQVLAMVFPGTSRSAATILAGLGLGLSRKAAAEFSFFLAIPVMAAASAYKLLKFSTGLSAHQWMLLAAGTIVSFFVAWGVIAWFMSFIRRSSFVPFAIYRIALALLLAGLLR